ncbi:A24 family peptidase [Pelagibacterium halotolerans]|uniref:Type IV prepilin peptidase TadV/CpaA n=2 Tax=Pelagibacterium TaxID=1082930 RepID=G4RFS1_PELHB|nr:type IV prepilin peptidase TadV/CpaA [Pelagibacterium halotolerans B2]
MRISNALVAVVVAGFVIIALVVGISPALIGMHLAAGALVLAVTFTLFAFGWIGGGDAKLAAGIAMWMGFELMLPFLLYASILGGALTFALLIGRRYALPAPLMRIGWIGRLHHPKTGVPYGIALAIGAMLVYPQTLVYERLITNQAVQQTLLDQLSTF